MISFKKVYGATRQLDRVEIPKEPPGYACVMKSPPKPFKMRSQRYEILMGREEAEMLIAARPDIFKMGDMRIYRNFSTPPHD